MIYFNKITKNIDQYKIRNNANDHSLFLYIKYFKLL